MFQFAGFPPAHYGFMRRYAGSSLRGFPHSDTRGSPGICPSPRLFAACRVFLRPAVPRHPPCALTCLSTAALPSVASRLPYSFTISLLGLMSLVLLLLCFWYSVFKVRINYFILAVYQPLKTKTFIFLVFNHL